MFQGKDVKYIFFRKTQKEVYVYLKSRILLIQTEQGRRRA